ncbi:MAG: Tm-1-like ATP-binding domain-containing protein [Anaerolineae bacterium]|nr:Tm-1-like ATP-binding domain-containing protein [Anaerolineae bacterium]
MATVLLIGTLDTKGPETAYLRDKVLEFGCNALVLDSGILGEAVGIEADINRREVAAVAGFTIDQLREAGTRGKAVEEMLKGVRTLTLQLYEQGRIHGVVSLGGAEGAVLAASAMKVLPMGFPKLIVSPIASGHRKFGPLIGTRDTLVMHSVVDILGLNPISRTIYDNAAAAISGMAMAFEKKGITTARTRKAIAATMLGNTTRPLIHIRPKIEDSGYDLVIFHANGVGGPAMEELIAQGYFDAVLDYTLSEVAGHIAGGFHNGGSARLDAAAQAGIPQVIVPGCLDFIVFGAKEEVPEKFHGRPQYYHNPEFTLVRLTPEEQLHAARFVVEKLNKARGTVSVVVPLGGGSVMDKQGGAFWDADLNQQVRDIFKNGLRKDIRYVEHAGHINDDAFAEFAYSELMSVLGEKEAASGD